MHLSPELSVVRLDEEIIEVSDKSKNAVIEIDNQEVPILDGSAKIFVEKIMDTGFCISNSPIKVIKVDTNIRKG